MSCFSFYYLCKAWFLLKFNPSYALKRALQFSFVDGSSSVENRIPDSSLRSFNMALKFFPASATCLLRSLAMWFVCSRQGISCRLVLGVDSEDLSGLEAHSWLEDRQGVVIYESSGGYRSLSDVAL